MSVTRRPFSRSTMQDERNLIKKAQDGEAEAFGRLYDQYLPKIYRFVLIKVTQREEAEDLTHQAFLQAWQSIESYNYQGFPFSSWLYRIARNIVIDYYRRPKSTIRLEDIDEDHRLFRVENRTEEKLDTSAAHKQVMKAIQSLTPSQQDVVIMRFVDDLSLKETAAVMGKSEGAIKLLQHRAITNLRKILKENEKHHSEN